MFYGNPGSGKSIFARQIAEHLHTVRLIGDSIRIAMFGSAESIDKAYTDETVAQLNNMVFGAIDYVAEQVLGSGQGPFEQQLAAFKTAMTQNLQATGPIEGKE
jgi:predicted kinase